MLTTPKARIAVCLKLTRAISTARTVEQIYTTALDALDDGLAVSRASILLFDPDGVMRFKASRGISAAYRAAVEGHTPWAPDSPHPEPIVIGDVTCEPSLAEYLPTIVSEGIAAMAFIPLVSLGRVIGKFMLYFNAPCALSADDIQMAELIAGQIAFAVERTRAEEQARQSEERLRFALDAASMGTWDWDLARNTVQWSENLERIHGLPPGTFDGTFESYRREIHPDDREQVMASAQRAIAEGTPHDIEYRIVSPDGTVRWVEGKGRVESEHGQPVRMSGVCMMVTRRKEAELARLAAAEEASRLKEEFLATLSHELRTPLNAIVGWIELLQDGSLSPDRARQAIDVIARNAKLQTQLIEDILDVSRIITGKLEIERRPVFVPQLVDAVVAGITPTANVRGLEIVKTVPEDVPPVEGDPKRLHQVVANVLSNAVKFTPDAGRVEIRVVLSDRSIVLSIRDSGIGIPPEFLPYVFDRFRQSDSRSTRKHGGLGLGLAIARHLVQQHGGDICAESEGPGRGTTITIRLPVGAHVEGPPIRATADVAKAPLPLRMDGTTVVVVDDERDSRELLANLFEQTGARVVLCDCARAAMQAVSADDVRLLVADIAMPEMDGYELIRRVRQVHKGLPAIAVSAYARHEDRDKAIAAGYTAYCAKPVVLTQLLETVRISLEPQGRHSL